MGAIVFDLDGTLIDSAPDIHDAANRVLAELGYAPLPLAQVRRSSATASRAWWDR